MNYKNFKDFLKEKSLTFVADDYRMSKGVDKAIEELLARKNINEASVMVTFPRFYENNLNKDYKFGLHFSLTNGKATSIKGKSLITDKNGNFNASFPEILILSFIKKNKMKHLIKKELETQLETLKSKVKDIHHINGHQHIHTIPIIFEEVKKISEKYKIKHIRYINEYVTSFSILELIKNWKNLIKLTLLRFLNLFNSYKTETYFMSILHTCKISEKVLLNYKIPSNFKKIEIMLHPGYPDIDLNSDNKDKFHLISNFRNIERRVFENLKIN